MITLTLPFPPSVNALYGQRAHHQRYMTDEYKEWLDSCPELPECHYKHADITYRFFFPDNRVRDSANYEKAVTDYLVKQQVIEDDNWKVIAASHLFPCGVDKDNPRVEIEIKQDLGTFQHIGDVCADVINKLEVQHGKRCSN